MSPAYNLWTDPANLQQKYVNSARNTTLPTRSILRVTDNTLSCAVKVY